MVGPRPFLSSRTAAQLQGIARRGFATVLAVEEPARIELAIHRQLDDGTYPPVIVDRFSVKLDERQTVLVTEEAAQSSEITGRVRRFVPPLGETRLQPGDRFTLPELGGAVIRAVLPDRFGVETAVWVLEGGAP